MAAKRQLYLMILLLLISANSFAQLNMRQITEYSFGKNFKDSKSEIKKLFSKQPRIMKADFLGAYKIIYEDVPFDFYGNADYTFLCIKDSMVSIEVEFEFTASDTFKFRRLYTTLISDFGKDNSKRFREEYSNINSSALFQEIETECDKNSNKKDKNYKPINIKSLGKNYWDIFSDKFIRMSISIGERNKAGNFNGEGKYDGCLVSLIIKVSSYNFLDLQDQLNKFSHQYTDTIDD